MPLLQVRDFPENLYNLLSLRAQSENRSITQQTIYMLSQDLDYLQNRNKLRRKELINSLSSYTLSEGAPSYTDFVRQDRERDEGGITW